MKKRILLPVLALLLFLTGCSKSTCRAHNDNNSDDICDTCGNSVIVVVDFYCINDLHGRILDTAAQPGIDELTTFLENARKTDDHVLLLSSGETQEVYQGVLKTGTYRIALSCAESGVHAVSIYMDGVLMERQDIDFE